MTTTPGTTPALTVGLDFTPNAAHAGIYAAVRTGADTENGVRIRIRPPAGGSPDSLKLLATGRADIGVLDIHDLGLALEQGADVVAVGALVQRPLAAVIARRDSGVTRPRELEGHRVGVAGLPSDDAVLRAVVEDDGGDFDEVDRVTIGFGAVANLLAGKVDAATAFWNAEGVVLRERGLQTREFRVDDFGAPPYPEVVLVVRRETLEERRDDIAAAVRAIADGTDAALADEEATVSRDRRGIRVRRGARARAGRGDRARDDASARPAPGGSRGLGALRVRVRDPRAPTRRGPRVRVRPPLIATSCERPTVAS